ncbi:MAG: oligosaccharide flippase family protein, partial [Bacteroidia bacterium]|nr:oligosaccharide flippase family protein [Bacteroidia bacterium]
MISKGFLKSSIVYTIGGAMPMAASIILLPFYTNYLNEIHFLQVSFYISISLLFQIFFSFSTDTYFGVKYSQLSNNPEKQKLFVGTNAILLLLIGLGWLVITAFTGDAIMDYIFKPEYGMEFWPYGFYAIITAFFNSYFKTSTNSLIYFKKPLLFLSLNLINFIATLLISIGGLFLFPDSIIGPMYGRLLSGLVIFLLANMVFFKFGKLKFEKEFLPDLFRFCTPYLFYVLSAWILSFIDRFMLQKHISETDLNTYDLVLKCFFGIEFLQN